jgi:predicted enzyme related to lactoylglutathione lyase
LPEGLEYFMITIIDDKGNKSLTVDMMKRQSAQQGITNIIDVKSIEEYSPIIERLGGKIVMPKNGITRNVIF